MSQKSWTWKCLKLFEEKRAEQRRGKWMLFLILKFFLYILEINYFLLKAIYLSY